MTKEQVLRTLQAHPDAFVSGEALSRELSVSRTAVWKAVDQLRQEGYPIESVPRRGHRLASGSDVLSAEGIRRYLAHDALEVRFFPTISSTTTVLRQMALENAPAGLALVAGEQTAGRGRLGRSFFSPARSGLYLSLLLRPDTPAAESTLLTSCAAVAVAEAIESLAHVQPRIKWVNDLLLNGKKICGILTEAGLDCETGRMSYVVIGIGINTRPPEGDFPEALSPIAGSAFGDLPIPDLRNRLAAQVLDRLLDYAANPGSDRLFEKYRDRLMVLGKPILILSPGRDPVPALALDLERDYGLRVRDEKGVEQVLHSGEISIRVQDA